MLIAQVASAWLADEITSSRRGCARQEAAMLSPEEQADLLDLTWHWETAYSFKVVDGVWQAIPAGDTAGVLTAESACQLREKVRADYAARRPPQGYLQDRMST
jgi:hypothetical protein